MLGGRETLQLWSTKSIEKTKNLVQWRLNLFWEVSALCGKQTKRFPDQVAEWFYPVLVPFLLFSVCACETSRSVRALWKTNQPQHNDIILIFIVVI